MPRLPNVFGQGEAAAAAGGAPKAAGGEAAEAAGGAERARPGVCVCVCFGCGEVGGFPLNLDQDNMFCVFCFCFYGYVGVKTSAHPFPMRLEPTLQLVVHAHEI